MADSKDAGLILLILGAIILLAGIFVGMSSTSLATSQQNNAYDIFASGTIRLALGIGIGCLGAVLIAVGFLVLK